MNGLGGQGHVCEKSSCQEKGARQQEKAGKESSTATARSSKAKLKSVHKPSAESREVSQAHERQEGLDRSWPLPRLQLKPSGKKTIATVPKKPGPGPLAPVRAASKPVSTSLAPKRRSGGSVLSGPVKGFTPYQPKRGEDYMNKDQLEHFRQLLLAWKRELMEEVDRTMLHMKDDAANFPDPNDRATQESEFGLELRTRDRERKLLKKIDSALSRIDDGSYGYCEETGDEIGLRRLEARPVATLCVEAQERRELAERQFRDREDQYR